MGRKAVIKTILTTTLGISLLAGGLRLSASEDLHIDMIRISDATTIRYSGLRGGGWLYEVQYSPDMLHWKHAQGIYSGRPGSVTLYSTEPQRFYRLKEGISADSPGYVESRLDPLSPAEGLMQIDSAASANDTVLGIFNLTPVAWIGQNDTMLTLRRISFDVYVFGYRPVGADPFFSGIKMKIGDRVFQAELVGNSATFKDLTVPLQTKKDALISVIGTTTQGYFSYGSGTYARAILACSGSSGGSRNNPEIATVQGELLEVFENTIESNAQIYSYTGFLVEDAIAELGAPIMTDGKISGYNVTFGFTVTAGFSDLKLSTDPKLAYYVGSSAGTVAMAFPKESFTASPQQVQGDDINNFVVPARSSRVFRSMGTVVNANGVVGEKRFGLIWVNVVKPDGQTYITQFNGQNTSLTAEF